MRTVLGIVILLAGLAFGVGCFVVFGKVGLVEASVLCGLVGLGAWILDAPDVQAFLERARTFLPGAKP